VRSTSTIGFVRALVTLTVLTLCHPAWAETKIGVVVGGADEIRPQTESAVGSWVTAHTLGVTPPMGPDGVNTLINCLVLSDMHCARNVVEARGMTRDIIGILEAVTGKGATRSVQISAYWIAKQHDVVSLQRTCDACTDAVLARTIDAVIADLARLAPTMASRIHITSKPAGLKVMVDSQPVGITPADHEVPFGTHTISLSRDGRVVGERQVDAAPTATLDVDVPLRAETPVVRPVEEHSRAVPVVMIVVGLAAVGTGAYLYHEGNPTGADFTYRDTKPAGIATAAGGGLLTIIGTILLFRHHSSAPDVAITSGGAMVGWAGSF